MRAQKPRKPSANTMKTGVGVRDFALASDSAAVFPDPTNGSPRTDARIASAPASIPPAKSPPRNRGLTT